jgi:hypothetical protein
MFKMVESRLKNNNNNNNNKYTNNWREADEVRKISGIVRGTQC